jgi:hypothetical protein
MFRLHGGDWVVQQVVNAVVRLRLSGPGSVLKVVQDA